MKFFSKQVISHICSTADEFETLYKEEETYDPSEYTYEFTAGQCYDHIWVTALALNCTDSYLKEHGRKSF